MASPELSASDVRAVAVAGPRWGRDAGVVVGGGLVAFAALGALPTGLVEQVAEEHGAVETGTLTLLAVATALAALAAWRGRWRGGYRGALILAACVARELDFHHRFTGESLTRGLGVKFLLSANVSWVERAVVVPLVAFLALTVTLFVWREWAGARRGLAARSYPVVLAVAAGALVLAAMALDDGYSTAKRLGPELAARWQLLEELLELEASALVVLALATVVGERRPARPSPPPLRPSAAGGPH